MSRLQEYLYAASVIGLSYKINDMSNSYSSQEKTEEFIYESLETDEAVGGIGIVLNRFTDEGLVHVVNDDVAGDFYRFNKGGILEAIDQFRNNPDSVGGRMVIVGLQLFHNALNNSNVLDKNPTSRMPIEMAPAADRLVTFDHNSAQSEEVISLTEAADEVIRGANSIEEEDRNWIRAHIQAGIEFIKKHKKMLAGAAAALLLEPLQAAYEAVAEEPAKVAILAAIDAVKMMFGI